MSTKYRNVGMVRVAAWKVRALYRAASKTRSWVLKQSTQNYDGRVTWSTDFQISFHDLQFGVRTVRHRWSFNIHAGAGPLSLLLSIGRDELPF